MKNKEKEKNFILITDKGVACGGLDPDHVLSRLLYSFLEIWSKEIFPIDTKSVGDDILDLMDEYGKEDPDDEDEDEEDDEDKECFADMLVSYILGDDRDDDEDNGFMDAFMKYISECEDDDDDEEDDAE